MKDKADAKEYTLKDLDSNFYFSNTNGEHLDSYVRLDYLISKYSKEWEQVLKYTWLDFLEHCFYLILPNIYPELEFEHEFPNEFEPTIDMFVLLAVQQFDKEVLHDKGYYLSDRAGHGYDLGILKKLGVNWVEMFYKNTDFNNVDLYGD